MPILLCFFILLASAPSDADTLLLSDSTRAIVNIIDTGGSFAIAACGNDTVQIDKKRILHLIVDRDTGIDRRKNLTDNPRAFSRSVNNAVERVVAGFPVKKTGIFPGNGIAYEPQPIAGNGNEEKNGTLFSNKMVSFLKRHGTVRRISEAGMYFYLAGGTCFPLDCRYLALPYQISVRSTERKMSVSSFVQLDKAGNFVPATKGATFKALERETNVRFLVFDLSKKTIIFDERVTNVDKGLKELDSKKSKDPQNGSGENSILATESNIEELLKKQFK